MLQTLSLVAIMLVALTCFAVSIGRNLYVALFAALNIAFILTGLMFLYADPAYVLFLFHSFKLELVTPADVLTTATIVTLGLAVSTACALSVPKVIGAGSISAGKSVQSTNYPAMALLGVALILGAAFVWNVAIMVRDIVHEINGVPNFLVLRQEVGSRYYLFILVVFNLLPMSTLYALLRREKEPRTAWLFWLLYAVSTVALLATFQKRPLIIFMALIAVVTCVLYWRRNRLTVFKALRPIPATRMALILSVPLIALFSLYYVEQKYGRGVDLSEPPGIDVAEPAPVAPKASTEPPPVIAKDLPKLSTTHRIALALRSTVSRILGRMAISSVLVVSHIPENHPHYGLTNVGLIAKMKGQPLYDPGTDVFSYFTRAKGVVQGVVATPAFIDLYGQYGWLGVVFGSALIGLSFGVLLIALRSVKGDFESYLFLLASSSIWVFYLSQANIFRAALSYGGGIFIASWVIFYGWSNFYQGKKKAALQ